MDTEALRLAARFSLPPNSLGYCGKGTATNRLRNCIVHGECEGVEEELGKFIVLHPYLKTIGVITGLPKFSYEVVECFWLGNDYTGKAKTEDYSQLLDNFLLQGVPDWFVAELRVKVPKAFIPFHLFQVLHVGVGKASGSVQFNLETINNCMIRWGKVLRIDDEKRQVTIVLNSLGQSESSYQLVQIEKTLPLFTEILPGLKISDVVAVHWGQAVKILTEKEEQNLSYWTDTVLARI